MTASDSVHGQPRVVHRGTHVSNHIMLEARTGRVSDECEVWDSDYHNESDTSEVIFGGTKEECVLHIAQLGNGSRYSLVEQGMCATCDLYDARRKAVTKGKQPAFLIVVTGTSRHYGGPEEGGWWDNRQEVLEVRKAYTLEQGLRHARKGIYTHIALRIGIMINGRVCKKATYRKVSY